MFCIAESCDAQMVSPAECGVPSPCSRCGCEFDIAVVALGAIGGRDQRPGETGPTDAVPALVDPHRTPPCRQWNNRIRGA